MTALELHTRHERQFQSNRFVYPVLSRRSGGISLGVNLNLDKRCNFDCIYCQVDRTRPGPMAKVDTGTLVRELDATIELITSGAIYTTEKFRAIPGPLRRFRDIALSGDGEPTAVRDFDKIVAACAEVKRRRALSDIKMVLITNASLLDRKHVVRGLEILDANQGEIWAKLDAGTEPYYRRVERTAIPFGKILANITVTAQVRPLVIQALLMQIHGQAPPAAEQEAFCDRLGEITAAGGAIRLVQISTIARRPAETFVTPLTDRQIDTLVALVRARTGLAVTGYYGKTP